MQKAEQAVRKSVVNFFSSETVWQHVKHSMIGARLVRTTG